MSESAQTIIVGVSGASGARYAQRLLDLLEQAEVETHVIVTEPARRVLRHELGVTEISARGMIGRGAERIIFHDNGNLASRWASGSCRTDGMVVCPCSSHCLAAVAAGSGDTLLLRSAYVTLKQKRPLLLLHREMPLTTIDMENMLRVARAGGTVCPAAPPFYNQPRDVGDLVDAVVARLLELLRVRHDLDVRWGGAAESE